MIKIKIWEVRYVRKYVGKFVFREDDIAKIVKNIKLHNKNRSEYNYKTSLKIIPNEYDKPEYCHIEQK